MSDYRKEPLFEKPFFTFARPYLDLLAKGSLFNLIYFVMAGINVILPFAVFVIAVNMGIFGEGKGNYAVAFIFSWVVIVFACWIGMQLWLDRRKKIMSMHFTTFIATFVLSDITQTLGEWLGTFIAITGAGVGLIAAIMLGKDIKNINEFLRMIGLDFIRIGGLIIFAGPLAGYLIIIVFRSMAEGLRLFVSLVNNTAEIAANIKRNAPAGSQQRFGLPAGPKGRGG
jgi:hypothetical protein